MRDESVHEANAGSIDAPSQRASRCLLFPRFPPHFLKRCSPRSGALPRRAPVIPAPDVGLGASRRDRVRSARARAQSTQRATAQRLRTVPALHDEKRGSSHTRDTHLHWMIDLSFSRQSENERKIKNSFS